MAKFAVVFDMDGVIADNMFYHRKAWEKFFQKYNPDMDIDEFIQHLGKPNKDLLTMLFGNTMTAEKIKDLGKEKEALYRKIYAPEVAPLPGFIPFLRSLKKTGVKTAVATAAPKDNLDFLLEHIDMKEKFEALIDVSEVTKGKPDPEIYLKAAEKLDFLPESCLVFEDSLAGIQAARNAGMKVIGVATTNPPEKLQHTDLVIHDFTEISLEKIFALMTPQTS